MLPYQPLKNNIDNRMLAVLQNIIYPTLQNSDATVYKYYWTTFTYFEKKTSIFSLSVAY